jgi:hypothetical protein
MASFWDDAPMPSTIDSARDVAAMGLLVLFPICAVLRITRAGTALE